jgi:glycosyltransferase involved in cell wall biosynthesis
MKIGVIAHLKHAIRAPFAGGLEMHTFLLCKLLRRRGHDVTLFAAEGSAMGLGLEAICNETGQTHSSEEQKFRHEHRLYLALMENLRESDFDIIHNNSLHYLPLALADGLPMPMVTVLHTPPFWEMEGSILHNKSRNSSFVAVSAVIQDLWAPITKVNRVIHNGIDLKQFRFTPVPSVHSYLVWSGRIVPEKGLHLAILAARRAGVNLRIAGPIADHLYFEKNIRPLLSEQTSYVGHLNHFELADLIGGARAILFTPLWEEPYGLVLAEALACGTPVASFGRGAVAEILDETCGIIVPPDNVAALAQAAHDVQRLSRSDCRQRAEAIADSGSMINQYEDLYRQLILRDSPRPDSRRSPFHGFPDTSNSRALLDHYIAQVPAMGSEIPASLR